jgi:hypothetical protein
MEKTMTDNVGSERHAMWLAMFGLVKAAVGDGASRLTVSGTLDELSQNILLLRDTQHLEAGMPAFDAGSDCLGLINAARNRNESDALPWLLAQVKANLDDAAAADLD